MSLSRSLNVLLAHTVSIVEQRGPILRADEDQEGAVLFNDDESLTGASRENSAVNVLGDDFSPATS